MGRFRDLPHQGPSPSHYLIALGSNVPHRRHGRPRSVLLAALAALAADDITVLAASPIVETAPLGPSRRRFANAAAVVATSLPPRALLARLRALEGAFGRRRRGARWRPRVLDLDMVLWSEGAWGDAELTVPHPAFRTRAFVLMPAVRIAPAWRDPLTGLSVRHIAARLTRRRPIP